MDMEPKLVVQSLTGLKAQILWALFFAGKGMGLKELTTWTSKPRNAHSGPLNALCGAKLLERRKMPHGEDWFCIGHDLLPILQDMVRQLGAGIYLQEPMQLLGDGQMSEKQTSGESPVIEAVVRSPADLDGLNAALRDYRIIGGMKNKLLACEWVTAEYVRSVVEYEKGEPKPESAVGRAILLMLDHCAQPVRRANGHIENCACAKCQVDVVFNKYRVGIPEYDEEEIE